jgi:Ca2+-binding EF-hand superfamily protein
MCKFNGTVSIQHFRRILNFAGITLPNKEFELLVKRFKKHEFTINYVSFLKAIKEIVCWFEKNGFLDGDKKFKEEYPGRIIVANVDSLPRPEVCQVDIAETFGKEKVCHPCLQQQKRDVKFEEVMTRIKKHVFDNRIRTRQFFEIFDDLRRGFVTKSQFHRGLDAIGLSGLHRFYVTSEDLGKVVEVYEDLCDPDRVAWSEFCDDVDEVFAIK